MDPREAPADPVALLVATAGHVDHGKSTLVRHLTGVDPDRTAEERRRGLTIDLGFATATLPSGTVLSLVDVPGHAHFLSTMVAGVGAVPACLLVVSAAEGWRAQSEEHLRILDLLGVRCGVVALTRAAVVAPDRLDRVRAEVATATAGTFLAGAEVVAVDLPAGVGLDALVAALDGLGRLAPAGPTPAPTDAGVVAGAGGRARLWVDRAFVVAGAGTVVTGTLTGDALHRGDRLALVADGRELPVRARQVQVHGEAVDRARPGTRTALNLAGPGVDGPPPARGAAVVRPGEWALTRTVDATLTVLGRGTGPRPGPVALRSGRGAHLAHLGTGEHAVHVRVLGGGAIEPGSTGRVRLRWATPLPLAPGDRYVLRDSGRQATVGGGEVLDVAPVLPAGRARPDRTVARAVAERGWVAREDLARLVGPAAVAAVPRATAVLPAGGEPPSVVAVGSWVASGTAVSGAADRLAAAVDGAGPLGLEVAAFDDRDRAVLDLLPVVVAAGRARPAPEEGVAAPSPEPASSYLAALRALPFRPPTPAEHGCPPEELRALRTAGLVVRADDLWFAEDAVAAATEVVAGLLAAHPDGVTVAQVRDALGTSRRWALPLLGLLDRRGVTRLVDGRRIAGPRRPGPTSTGRAGPGPDVSTGTVR